MTSPTEAFEAGLLALGFVVRGDREQPDPRMARKVLTAATRADPQLADAWLARLAAGDRTAAVYEGLWRSRHRIGAALAHYGLAAHDLKVRYESGMLINAPLRSSDAATAAYVASLCQARRFDDAVAVFTPDLGAANPLTTFAAAALYYQTERWPQVVDVAMALRDYPQDAVLSAAARALIGHAQALLGLHKAAIATATETIVTDGRTARSITEILPESTATVSFFLGVSYRALGLETEAAEAFRAALVADAGHAAAREMLANTDLQLPTVDQLLIDSRTDPWDPASAADPGKLAREQNAADREKLLAAADAELDAQIGLASVKHQVKKLKATVRMNKARINKGLPPAMRSYHLIFEGPPGTGKTTIARVVANIYCGLGVLSTTNVVEVSRADLVGQYEGHSAPKTNAMIDKALGGVLFIDEAYTLVQDRDGRPDPFGTEALNTLLARMENDRDRLMVIIAGYSDEIDRFLAANEGLASRFPTRIPFPSYSPAELVDIAGVLASKSVYHLDDSAREVLMRAFTYLADHDGTGDSGERVDVDELTAAAARAVAEWQKLVGRTGDPAAVERAMTRLRQALPASMTTAPAATPMGPGPQGGRSRRLLDVAGNGRFARNVIEAAVSEQALRLTEGSVDIDALDADTMTPLTASDVHAAVSRLIRDVVKKDVAWD
ncbi:hypothetical protein EB74_30075 [Mycobacterium sp. SWH-M5]|uniref:type VII secretion AAA-ATPase EccA n=1 Tax=Mycolicibacterium goodii TaxID=134601 RepID=UPI00093C95DB|nr:type VII secretion AAA-ATPase EccA [Mycolicibacterium goodii]MBU8817531.1 type VII secretion AAA-ATPase EccA [Mycolicibacterium goodii]OKH69414.1 hypothetical protein EB74_30075 [Mycobacterium sp. SWH-M5]